MNAPTRITKTMVIKIGLPSGTDLSMELNENTVEEIMPPLRHYNILFE